jgi:hypothetical protein
MKRPFWFAAIASTVLLAAACGADTANTALSQAEPSAQAGVVDSIFPVEEALRRFRATLPYEAGELENAAASSDELVQRFVVALEAADREALVRLVMNRSEFGYLYYEHTCYTRPPFELPPEVLWFQMQNRSGRGLTRLLDRLAGEPLGYLGYHCPEAAREEGPNRLWPDCMVRITSPQGESVEARLFGSILERDGRFKFVSYANEL